MRISDWSSDVCSSDLASRMEAALRAGRLGSWNLDLLTGRVDCSPACKANFGLPSDASFTYGTILRALDRKSVVEGKSVSVRVDLGGRRIMKKKKTLYYRLRARTHNFNNAVSVS